MKRKILFALVFVALIVGGYLGYDYYMWQRTLDPDPEVNLYGWTDAGGVRHFTDTPPPGGARDVRVTYGFKHHRLPLVLQLREKIVSRFRGQGSEEGKNMKRQR